MTMKFDFRADSDDFLRPIHAFPGDQAITHEQYRSTIVCGYASSATTVAGAAEGFRLGVDNETVERWKRIGAAAGLLDDFLDESPDIATSCHLYSGGMRAALYGDEEVTEPVWTDERLRPAVQLLQNSVTVLPKDQVNLLEEAAQQIGIIAWKKSTCSDLDAYVNLLKCEAMYSSILIYSAASENVRQSKNFWRFAVWCKNAMELGTFWDSARDLPEDYRDGRTCVEPSVLNMGKIASHIRRPVTGMLYRHGNMRATSLGLLTRRNFYR